MVKGMPVKDTQAGVLFVLQKAPSMGSMSKKHIDNNTKIVYNIIVVEERSSHKEEYERRTAWKMQ